MNADPWRIGLSGCGTSVSLYEGIQAPGQDFQLVAVADQDIDKARAARQALRASTFYPTQAEMLQKEDLQLLLIATPPSTHRDLILEAVRLGVPVIVQKPLARTLAEAREVLQACRDRKVALLVSFSRRYTPAFLAARDLIGTLGHGLALRASWCSSSGYSASTQKRWKRQTETLGGVLVDLGSHVLDLSRWWMGEIVQGQLEMAIAAGELENVAAMVMRHASGSSTLCYLSNVEGGRREIYEYVATGGGFSLERQTEGYPGEFTLRSWSRTSSNTDVLLYDHRDVNPFLSEIRSFMASLKRGDCPIDDGDLGMAALEASTLLYASASAAPRSTDLDTFPIDAFFRNFPRV
jgi:scyllo-inositol 2-dehydrogenase (NADP+)